MLGDSDSGSDGGPAIQERRERWVANNRVSRWGRRRSRRRGFSGGRRGREARHGEENSEMGAAERRCGRDEEDAGERRRWEKRDTVRFDVNGVGGMENIRKIYICCLNY